MTKKRLQDPELIAIAGQVITWIGFAEFLKRLVNFDGFSQHILEKRTNRKVNKLIEQLESETIRARSSIRVIEKSLEQDFEQMPRDIIALNILDDEFSLYHKAFIDFQQSTTNVYKHAVDLRINLKEYGIDQERFFKITQRSEMLREIASNYLDEIMCLDEKAMTNLPNEKIEKDESSGRHPIKNLLEEGDKLLGLCQRDMTGFKEWIIS
jgi:hypothetical protein